MARGDWKLGGTLMAIYGAAWLSSVVTLYVADSPALGIVALGLTLLALPSALAAFLLDT